MEEEGLLCPMHKASQLVVGKHVVRSRGGGESMCKHLFDMTSYVIIHLESIFHVMIPIHVIPPSQIIT